MSCGNEICFWLKQVFAVVIAVGITAGFLYILIGSTIDISKRPHVTVRLVGARGLDVDDQSSAIPVEFDVPIGFVHLDSDDWLTHDGGHVTISYAGVGLAEGAVPKFNVTGGPQGVEATRATALADKDQAPLSQMFRERLWMGQQVHGEVVFEVALSFYDVEPVSGVTRRSYHTCKVGLPLQGQSKTTKCGR